jgi:hypothetical protein
VDIKKDDEGYLGRECPECEKYFKIKPGTGIPDFSDCYCPYCQHLGPRDHFWTKQQIEYAQSVVLNNPHASRGTTKHETPRGKGHKKKP